MTNDQPDSDRGTPASSLRADEPIRSIKNDLLSRGRLLKVIAGHILATDGLESVVIGLNAPWGAGKSSFLNLLEERLAFDGPGSEKASTKHPTIIRFNPWHFGNVEQLVRMFFSELALGIGSGGETKKKIGELLNTVGSIVSAVGSIAPPAKVVGSLMQGSGNVLKSEKSLHETKADLNQLLKKLDQRVVIFVDDIDRLEPDVTKLLFRMVRLNANLPNVIYVLAFDRLVVERNLDDKNGIRGRDYLEKIIQVSFDIPESEPATIRDILFTEMNMVLESLETRSLDEHRWGELFHSGFKEHFRTIRHVKRFANGLRLTLPPVAQEVDLVDFLAIELFRVFHPEIYGEVVRGKDMLAFNGIGEQDQLPAERIKQWTESLCSKASPGFKDPVRSLLRQLFPPLAIAYTNVYRDPSDAQWRTNCRVCSPDVFDKFFLLAVPVGDVSQVEMTAFVEGLADSSKTVATLRGALQSGKARRLLERLEDFIGDLPVEHVAPLLKLMLDFGDAFQFEQRGMFDLGDGFQVMRIIYQSVHHIAAEQDRCKLLLTLIKTGKSLGIVVRMISLLQPNDEPNKLLTDRGQWAKLRDTALARIRSENTDGTLWQRVQLPDILIRWSTWDNKSDVRAAVAAHVESDAQLLCFIRRFVRKSHILGGTDRVPRSYRRIEKSDFEGILDLTGVARRLRKMQSGGGENAAAASELLSLIENDDKCSKDTE